MKYLIDKQTGGVYHCMSRCVQGRRLFKKQELEVFRKMLWQVAEFSGLEVVTYCLMSNHFHILVRVPHSDTKVTDAELVRRFGVLYPVRSKFAPMTPEALADLLAKNDATSDDLRLWLRRRMHNVSEFMRTLKLRYSLWYNRTHDTFGALWANRFQAVLVEDKPSTLRIVAAYIDLNPVRAGLVKDPKDYRFCGYAESLLSRSPVRTSLAQLFQHEAADDTERLAAYRYLLFFRGSQHAEGKATMPEALVKKVLSSEKGTLPLAEVLRCKLRYLTEGLVIGSENFVRSYLGERKRKALFQDRDALPDICSLRSPRKGR